LEEGPSSSRALTDQEITELLKLCHHEPHLNGGEWRNKRRQLIVLLGLHGFGPAEICGLQYGDFDGSGFHPHRQAQRFREKGIVHRERLKTKARHARVPARRAILDLLDPNGQGWIVCTETGGPMEPGNLRKVFSRMITNTKFEGVTPYDLRHTFANELLRKRVDVKTAADLMRHSVETFLRRYVHGNETLKNDAIKKLDF
jgi:integrase